MSTQKKTAEQIRNGLAQFYGGDQRYRHGLVRSLIYSEGVQWLAENAGAYWLIDVVASYQHTPALKKCDGFQFWNLAVDLEQHTGLVTCIPDKDLPPVITQQIEYTDFPLESIDLWCVDEGDEQGNTLHVLILPTEY